MPPLASDTLVLLPSDHQFSLVEPFLVTSQHAIDVGLVGWDDRRWTVDAAESRPSRKQNKRQQKAKARDECASASTQLSEPERQTKAWRRAFDPSCSAFYFYNEQLSVTQWEPPEEGYTDDSTVAYYTAAAQEGAPSAGTAPADDDATAAALGALDLGDVAPAHELFAPRRKGDLRPEVEKYWIARYSLFSRWSDGVRLNETSLFSVTPEVIAKHQAQMLAGRSVVIDAFCGCGGNAIQLAMICDEVIACDVDAEQLHMARWNAHVYGVADRIQFKHVDFFQAAATLRADAVFLSPPWGGPEYLSNKLFRPELPIPGFDRNIRECVEAAARCLQRSRRADTAQPLVQECDEPANVALFLPKTTSVSGLASCLPDHVEPLCLERNHLNGTFKGVTLYALVHDA